LLHRPNGRDMAMLVERVVGLVLNTSVAAMYKMSAFSGFYVHNFLELSADGICSGGLLARAYILTTPSDCIRNGFIFQMIRKIFFQQRSCGGFPNLDLAKFPGELAFSIKDGSIARALRKICDAFG